MINRPKTVTAQEMRELDRQATVSYGISSLLLMENAGRGIAEMIYGLSKSPCRVTLFCGRGNNGGDGFVIARHLFNRGFQVYVCLINSPTKFSDEAKVNFEIILKMKIPYQEIQNTETLEAIIKKSDIVVDAIFGTGLSKPIEGIIADVIGMINQFSQRTLAVDLPSGLNADTGEVMGIAIQAAYTATLGLPKKGLFEGCGPQLCGKIGVIDIGLPKSLLL